MNINPEAIQQYTYYNHFCPITNRDSPCVPEDCKMRVTKVKNDDQCITTLLACGKTPEGYIVHSHSIFSTPYNEENGNMLSPNGLVSVEELKFPFKMSPCARTAAIQRLHGEELIKLKNSGVPYSYLADWLNTVGCSTSKSNKWTARSLEYFYGKHLKTKNQHTNLQK